MLFRLCAGGVIVEHDLGSFLRVLARPFPALHRGRNELRHLLDESRILELVFHHIEAVFHRGDALVFVFEHDQLVGRNAAVNHLPIFVVGHGRHAIRLLLEQWIDVEALLQHLHATCGTIGLETELRHPAEERIFIAVEPDAERAALQISRCLDAGFGAAGQHHAGTLERLGDIDQWHTLFAGRESRWHPVDNNVSAAACEHLWRSHVRAARLDRDINAGILVETLVLRDVIACELGLRDPFQLQRHLVCRMRRSDAEAREGRHSQNNLPHSLLPRNGAHAPSYAAP